MSSSSTLYPPLRITQSHLEEIEKFEAKYTELAGKTISQMFEIQEAEFEKSVIPKYVLAKQLDLEFKEGKKWRKELSMCIMNDTLISVILSKWRYNKQVYTFSKEFAEILAEMDEFQIDMSIFKYLPFEAFYLEIEDSNEVAGVLVRFLPESMEFVYCVLYKECGENGENLIKTGYFFDLEKTFKSFYDMHYDMTKGNAQGRAVLDDFKKTVVFTLQASMYLCASNTDIEENEYQKKIYRPSQRIKNKYSEIRKWDVGMRVMKERKQQEIQCMQETSLGTNSIKERQRPRMHWRKAHWHTYLTGPGKNKRELRFIAPILVNDIADELPVVKRINQN